MATYQTPDLAGAGNCNDSLATLVNSGTASTANCISRYGALDLIGNVWSWTDTNYASISSSAGVRTTFYGTGSFAINDSSATFPATNFIAGYDFARLIPNLTSASGIASFFSDYFWVSAGNVATYRGGDRWNAGVQSGRFAVGIYNGPTYVSTHLGGRCALSP